MNVMAMNEKINESLLFGHDGLVNVNGGTGYVDALTEGINLDLVKNLTTATFNVTYKCTTSGVNTLMFIGDSTTQNNHINVYLNGKTLGIEIRNASGTYVLNEKVTLGDFYDTTKQHKFSLKLDGTKCYFYVDGEKVKEVNTTTALVKDIVSHVNFVGFGKGQRLSSAYNYTGQLSKIELYNTALNEEDILTYHADTERVDLTYKEMNRYFNSGTTYAPITDLTVESLKALSEGTISVRFRAESATDGLMSLFSLSNNTAGSEYFSLFVDPSQNRVGIDIVGGIGSNGVLEINGDGLTNKGVAVNNTDWHTMSLVKEETGNKRYYLYLDGQQLGYWSTRNQFLDGIANGNAVGIGYTDRLNGNEYKFTGGIDSVRVYSTPFSAAEIVEEHNEIKYDEKLEDNLDGAYKTEGEVLFEKGYDNSPAYRIPALLTTSNNTVIAGIDKRNTNMLDAGNIDISIRRREAGSEQFSDPIIVIDLNDSAGEKPSFLIDSCFVEDKTTGELYMVVDMFPESNGLMTSDWINEGSGFEEIDGKYYQEVYTDGRDKTTKFGTIRDDGYIYDLEGTKTNYHVTTEAEMPFKALGDLYEGETRIGNVYRYTGEDAGKYTVLRTQNLWVTKSSDDGVTWSTPKNITPQVKQDWMIFLGTGPGVGIQAQNGNIIVPVYSAGRNVGGTQSSAIIVSEDHGETWTLKESPNANHNKDASLPILTESQLIQTPNGDLHLFMRNGSGKVKESVSSDYGNTWSTPKQIDEIKDVYCQLTVTSYEKNGEMYVVLANPTGESSLYPARNTGKVYLGKVGSDGTTIDWLTDKYINHQRYGYSCITVVENDEVNPIFGLLYEDETHASTKVNELIYTEFDEKWITNGYKSVPQAAAILENSSATINGNKITVKLTFDQAIMAVGTPQLQLQMAGTMFNADYSTGSGTKVLTFSATLPENTVGQLKVVGVNETKSYFENTIGDKVTLNQALADLGEIETGTSVSDYTSQQSTSTAENTDGAATNVVDGNIKLIGTLFGAIKLKHYHNLLQLN